MAQNVSSSVVIGDRLTREQNQRIVETICYVVHGGLEVSMIAPLRETLSAQFKALNKETDFDSPFEPAPATDAVRTIGS